MNDASTAARPGLVYWIAALASLIWNSFGGVDYLMSKLRNMDYLTSAMGGEQGAREMLALLDAMPLWAHFLWGLGVWSSVLGSILLIVRSRHAAPVFLVSLVAAALSFAYQATLTFPEALDTPMNRVMPLVILAAIALQWWWARKQQANGLLK
mgnify:FL=1